MKGIDYRITDREDVIVSTKTSDAGLSAAFADTGIASEESSKLKDQWLLALYQAERFRQRGDIQGAWLHLRMAEKILAQMEPERA